MSSVLRMVVSDATSHAEIPTNEEASPTAASDAQLAAGHLVRCPECGALNGRSVTACWSCESQLTGAAVAVRGDAAAAASNEGAGHRPAHETAHEPAQESATARAFASLPTPEAARES